MRRVSGWIYFRFRAKPKIDPAPLRQEVRPRIQGPLSSLLLVVVFALDRAAATPWAHLRARGPPAAVAAREAACSPFVIAADQPVPADHALASAAGRRGSLDRYRSYVTAVSIQSHPPFAGGGPCRGYRGSAAARCRTSDAIAAGAVSFPHVCPQPAVTAGCPRWLEFPGAAAPRGGGRRHASSWPLSAFCGGNAPAPGREVRLASGGDAAFAFGAPRAAAQSDMEGTGHDRAAPGRRSDMLIPPRSG